MHVGKWKSRTRTVDIDIDVEKKQVYIVHMVDKVQTYM